MDTELYLEMFGDSLKECMEAWPELNVNFKEIVAILHLKREVHTRQRRETAVHQRLVLQARDKEKQQQCSKLLILDLFEYVPKGVYVFGTAQV